MAPKAREIDLSAVRERLSKGDALRDIARSLDIPESTLRHHLKKGPPKVSLGIQPAPIEESPLLAESLHGGDEGIPPLYVHPGIPDASTEESIPLAEGIAEDTQDIPALPLEGGPQAYEGIPQASLSPQLAKMGTNLVPTSAEGLPQVLLSPQLAEALTLAWPDLQSLLVWWQERQQQIEAPGEKLERATYHVSPRWIDAIKREADRTGDSYAAVVNRAFRQYFTGR